MNNWRVWISVLVMGILCSPAVMASERGYPTVGGPVEIGELAENDVVLLVGIEAYPWLPDVAGVSDTIRDWEDFFQIGLQVPTVFTLTENQATREGIQRYLEEATAAANPESTVWFVYVGHGAPDPEEGDGLLVGVDAQASLDSLVARSLRRSEIVDTLERGPQARTVVILDACFTGEAASGEALVPGAQPVLPTRVEPRVQRETVILSAAGAGEIAGPLPGAQRPAFSYFLLGALRGWAAGDEDEVTASSAIGYTRTKLRTVRERRQTPEFFGAEDLVLVRGVSEPDPLPRWRGMAPDDDPRALRGYRPQRSDGQVSDEPVIAREQPTGEPTAAQMEAFEEVRIFESSGAYYQGSWTNQLAGRAFYEAIERPDLADEYRPHRPGGILGLVVLGLGVGVGTGALFGVITGDDGGIGARTGYMISGGIGGGMIGWYLGRDVFQERHPLSASQRAGAVREFNQAKARELGIPSHLTVAPAVGTDQLGMQMNLTW